ncbi:hypothetical protein PMZ88_25585, partial [Escherichia coli]|nr:hypothetical protein [Escherichia coli]
WLMMSLWDALRMNMMISYQELVRTFPNASTATAKAAAVAVEVWSTSTPGKNGAKQFSCVTPATEEVSIAGATGGDVVDYPMSAVLVVAKDKTVTDVTAGDFTAPATFTVTYN